MKTWKLLTLLCLVALTVAGGLLLRTDSVQARPSIPDVPPDQLATCYQAYLTLATSAEECPRAYNYWGVYLGTSPPSSPSQLCSQVPAIVAQAQAQG